MFVVIFEVHPKTEQLNEYLGLGKLLHPELNLTGRFLAEFVR